ncbi:MAG: hypothetical protein IAF58_03805 [Leptolyngbya sp.]|nr:hypothetical protein [Candidatus Melainabacteria bacterium]
MHKLNKIFEDNKKVTVMAGDLDQGEWEFSGNTLWGAFGQVELGGGAVKSVTQHTEESVKKLSTTLGWGLAGGLVLGPAGAVAGLVFGGNRKNVCVMVELKDGRKFLATMDSKIYQQLLALTLMK